jgi:hypothetical protein
MKEILKLSEQIQRLGLTTEQEQIRLRQLQLFSQILGIGDIKKVKDIIGTGTYLYRYGISFNLCLVKKYCIFHTS